MIVNGQTLLKDAPIVDMLDHKAQHSSGLSYGLTEVGYDIRVKQGFWLHPFMWKVKLASSIERFNIPPFLAMTVHDKSTLARRGVSVQNTTGEPGWDGHLTLELSLNQLYPVYIEAGQPIDACWFHEIQELADYGSGKYQDQPDRPIGAR